MNTTTACPICHNPKEQHGCTETKNGEAFCNGTQDQAVIPGYEFVRERLGGATEYRKLPVEDTGGPVLVRMADVNPEPIRWLWPGRIALGKLTMLVSDPGLSKSFIALDMASRVSRGGAWPDQRWTRSPLGGVVLLTAEDDLADTVRPRLDAAGADVSKIVALQAVELRDPDSGKSDRRMFDLTADIDALETAIRQTPDCRLAIIDPLSAYLGRVDSHKNAEVRAALAGLSDLAALLGVAVVAISHLNKASSLPAVYRAMGSLAFVAAARAVWAIAKDADDPSGRRRLMVSVKNNLAIDQTGLAYELRSEDGTTAAVPCVAWESEPINVSADDALATDRPRGDDEGGALGEAVTWLQDVLADGPVEAKIVKQWARRDGIATRTLDRAKTQLYVIAAKTGFADSGKWSWRLSDPSPGATTDDQPDERKERQDSPTRESLAPLADVGALSPHTTTTTHITPATKH